MKIFSVNSSREFILESLIAKEVYLHEKLNTAVLHKFRKEEEKKILHFIRVLFKYFCFYLIFQTIFLLFI